MQFWNVTVWVILNYFLKKVKHFVIKQSFKYLTTNRWKWNRTVVFNNLLIFFLFSVPRETYPCAKVVLRGLQSDSPNTFNIGLKYLWESHGFIEFWRGLINFCFELAWVSLKKQCSFPLRICSVNVTKSAVVN